MSSFPSHLMSPPTPPIFTANKSPHLSCLRPSSPCLLSFQKNCSATWSTWQVTVFYVPSSLDLACGLQWYLTLASYRPSQKLFHFSWICESESCFQPDFLPCGGKLKKSTRRISNETDWESPSSTPLLSPQHLPTRAKTFLFCVHKGNVSVTCNHRSMD